jgi:hypothetical protein
VRWQALHRDCDEKPVPVMCPDFLIWASQLGNANDLAKITVDMMEQPWINSTNWPGTVRRILSDTYRHAETTKNNGRKK